MAIPRDAALFEHSNSVNHFRTRYHISGFRSLDDFDLCLENGLNVLVGTNGAGKTNFIDFLDFLSILVRQGGAAAISNAGGIARVFSQETLKKKIPKLIAKVSGVADLRDHLRRDFKSQRTFFHFDYEVEIRYSRTYSAVYISHESLRFKGLFGGNLITDRDSSVGSIDLRRRSPLEEDDVNFKVGPYLKSNSSRNPLKFSSRFRTLKDRDIAEVLSRTVQVEVDRSLLENFDELPAIGAVLQALSRGRSFNLSPQQARVPDDISKPPYIDTDGSGLSSTLYQMSQARKSTGKFNGLRSRRFRKDMIEHIVTWTKLVIPELRDITVTADPHTGKYLAYLIVESDDQDLKIPLQSASDGTLKWLAFVALIVTQGRSYTFEEPENFLHPKMQRFLVELMREEIDRNESPGHFILSTHSETVINQCKPSEIILFQFVGGKTTASRLENQKSLEKEINRTGFGLGYYYAANVVS